MINLLLFVARSQLKAAKNAPGSFATHVCPSVWMPLTTTERLKRISWNYMFGSLLKFVDTFQFWLKSFNNNGDFTKSYTLLCTWKKLSEQFPANRATTLGPTWKIRDDIISHTTNTAPTQRLLTTDNFNVTGAICKGQKSNLAESTRNVIPYVCFLTCTFWLQITEPRGWVMNTPAWYSESRGFILGPKVGYPDCCIPWVPSVHPGKGRDDILT
jgi:hypothetical protein